jgi:hypothetical protein
LKSFQKSRVPISIGIDHPKRRFIVTEITDLLQQKAGLSPEQSQAVLQLVASHLQSHIPESLHGLVLPFLGVQATGTDGQPAASSESGGLGGLLSEATSLFGSKG